MEKLIRIFVKDSENLSDNKVRSSYGTFVAVSGIVCNLFLSLLKLFIGLLTDTTSIINDAFNNFSDMFSSVVTLIGFRLSGKKADAKHPYGHGRIEYLAGLCVSVTIIFIALELMKNSVKGIVYPSRMDVSYVSFLLLVFSMFVKFGMSLLYKVISGRISSKAIAATAADCRNDGFTTATVVFAIIVKLLLNINIDAYVGLIVSVYVLGSGLSFAYSIISSLLGDAPDPKLLEQMKAIALSHPEVQGIHDIRVHEYGPAEKIASFHAEIPSFIGMIRAHELVDEIETEIQEAKLVNEISIHVDPIITDDEQLSSLRQWTLDQLKEYDEEIAMHDFRLLHSKKQIRVLFDLEIPYGYEKSEEDLRNYITDRFHEVYPQYNVTIVAIDRK